MVLPVIQVTRPSNIQGLTAAQISRSNPKQLVPRTFPGVGTEYLHPNAARCYDALSVYFNMAVKDGGTGCILSCAGHGSGHRLYSTQVGQFNLRMTPTYSLAINGATNRLKNRRKWNKTPANSGPGPLITYYLRKGMIPIAVPGEGQHPLGLGLDTAIYDPATRTIHSIRSNPAAFAWLVKNAGKYGWSWENAALGVDDPHLHYWAGDNIPQAVLQVEAWFKGQAK
jgi:hypothetical protein